MAAVAVDFNALVDALAESGSVGGEQQTCA
jgi:hypothetical protein